MSLINKMLQDLEERHSEGAVVGSMHHEIRSAPERGRLHFAWWIALALLLVLTAAVSWLLGRETAPAGPQPQLSLKIAPGLPASPPSAEKTVPGGLGTAAAVAPPAAGKQPEPPASKDATPAGPKIPAPVAEIATPAVVADRPAAVSPPAPTAAVVPAAPVPAKTAGTVSAQQKGKWAATVPVPPAETVSAHEIPVTVSKQIKELTTQQRAENEFRKATTLIQQGRSADAMATLEQALQLDGQHIVARQTLVGLLLEAKRQDDAVRKLQEGLALDRSQPALAMMLARLQVERSELRSAIETLQRTLPHAADRADYHAFLAALFQRDGRHKEAVESYAVALRRSPQSGLWWMGMGISLQAENRLADARDAFGRARASNSLSPELHAFVEQKLSQLPR